MCVCACVRGELTSFGNLKDGLMIIRGLREEFDFPHRA